MLGRILAATVLLGALAGPAVAAPIPERTSASADPEFLGGPATPSPISLAEAPRPPRHPSMAPNDASNIHDDAYQTDTADRQGPLGRGMQRTSTFYGRECASVTFDSRGRIETICVGLDRTQLKLLDPRSLDELASFDLPPRQTSVGGAFSDFSGGGYFYLDQHDRAVVPTSSRHLLVVGQSGSGFAVQRDYDLSGLVAGDDKLIAAMPDWSGLIWVVSTAGEVITVDPASGRTASRALGERIGNSFAVDDGGGVYVVTDAAIYRLDADGSGRPGVSWRQPYPNTGQRKPGQTESGSGTTPTLMGRDYVAITDNADPMQVVVYRRAKRVRAPRTVCAQRVFGAGASATDNSLIGTARSLVVENNYGYSGPTSTEGGSSVAGLQRVDVLGGSQGCRLAWTSGETAPSVVPKLSLENGLVYTYTKEADTRTPAEDPWYFTALDFRTGRTVFKRLAGRGLGFNNNYAPVSLGPDGSAYVGALGGLVALRDASAPPRVRRPAGPRPRLRLAVRGLRRVKGKLRRCAPRGVKVRIRGADAGLVVRSRFAARGRRLRRLRRDARSPFTLTLSRRTLRPGRRYRVRASGRLYDQRLWRGRISFRRCR